MQALKQQLRTSMRAVLRHMSPVERISHSQKVCERVIDSKRYKDARGICLFASMPLELNTNALFEHALANNKRCFIPRVLNDTEMEMREIFSLEDMKSFIPNKWGIIEPPSENRDEALECDELDLVVIPGMAFDKQNRRLGMGKGYYDRYLTQLAKNRISKGIPVPYNCGICFPKQMISSSVPYDKHDVVLDTVFS